MQAEFIATPDDKQTASPAKTRKHETAQRHTSRKPTARSAVTNGSKQFLDHVDGRKVFSRRMHDLMALFIDDLSGGAGADSLSEAQVSLIRRACIMQLSLEELEMHMANGDKVDLDQYSRLVGHLRRVFETIGLRRVRKDVTPQLHAYVKKETMRREQDEGD